MNNVGGSGNYGHVSDRLLRYFKDLGCKTMLDIGCGIGMNVAYANEIHGYDAWGVEGDINCQTSKLTNNFILHDFENNGFLDKTKLPYNQFDLVYCVVVSEHIEDSANAQFMDALSLGKWVVFTWCEPGYPGHHHVNCQLPEYWIEKFQAYGYKHLVDRSFEIRRLGLNMFKQPWWRDKKFNSKQIRKPYLRDWGMVFRQSQHN